MGGDGIRWILPLRGRRVFSVWAWAIVLPFGLFATGGYDLASSADEFARGAAIALVAQLAVGVAFIIGNLVERRLVTDAVHIAWVVAVLLGISVGRPALIIALQEVTGGQLFPDQGLLLRAGSNLLTLGLPTVGVFVLVQTVMRSRGIRRRLESVIACSEQSAAADEAASAALVSRLRVLVVTPVIGAIADARVSPFDAERQAEALRLVAHSVVRPLSHTVIEMPVDDLMPGPPPTGSHAGPASGPPLRIVMPAPWIAPVAIVGLTIVALVVNYGAVAGALAVLVIAIGTSLGSLARSVPTQRMRPGAGIATVAALGLGIGVVISAIMIAPAPFSVPAVYWVTTPLAFAALTTVMSAITSVSHQLTEDERLMAALVTAAERRATAARANLRDLVSRVGRSLHTEVQGRVVATALRLRLGVAGPDALDDLLVGVADDLDDALEPAVEHRGEAAPELLQRAISAWTSALPVSLVVDPDVWPWLAVSPARTELLLEAVSEALSNTVRHGDDGDVEIVIDRIATGARLVVRSSGHIHRGDDDGVGLRSLVEQGAGVTLVAPAPGSVMLTVDLGEEIGLATMVAAG